MCLGFEWLVEKRDIWRHHLWFWKNVLDHFSHSGILLIKPLKNDLIIRLIIKIAAALSWTSIAPTQTPLLAYCSFQTHNQSNGFLRISRNNFYPDFFENREKRTVYEKVDHLVGNVMCSTGCFNVLSLLQKTTTESEIPHTVLQFHCELLPSLPQLDQLQLKSTSAEEQSTHFLVCCEATVLILTQAKFCLPFVL